MLIKNKNILLYFKTFDYVICFNFEKNECKVQNEFVKLNCDIEYGNNQKIQDNEIIIKNNNGNVKVEFLDDLAELEISEIIPDT